MHNKYSSCTHELTVENERLLDFIDICMSKLS